MSLQPQKKLRKAELKRLQKLVVIESEIRQKGFLHVAGIDEAGRGPLAGPVVAAACIIQEPYLFEGINDSKLLLPAKRQELFEELTHHPHVFFGIGIVESYVIDEINILQATLLAMQQAVQKLPFPPDYLLIDGNQIPKFQIPCQKIVKGDQLSQSIAAASIIAKETRDTLMKGCHHLYPEYGFADHKGYATPQHLEALQKFGPCPIHRRSFEPVRASLQLELFKDLDVNVGNPVVT